MAEASGRWSPRADVAAAPRVADVASEQPAALIGDPVPLGLLAFGTATFVAGTVLAGWWSAPGQQLFAIAPLLLVFGGIAQFVTAMWSYGRGHTVPATFLGAFGAFFAMAGVYAAVARTAPVTSRVLGPLAVGVACFAFIALFVAAASSVANPGLTASSALLGVGLALLAWAFFAAGNSVLEAISGWFGIVSAAVAILTAAGMTIGGRIARLGRLGT